MIVSREPEFYPDPRNPFEKFGRIALLICRDAGRGLILFWEAMLCMRFALGKRMRNEVVFQMYTNGIKSLPVITIVAMFTGMILALQTGIELRRFGQEVAIGGAVTVSMLREMGPFMTGLILAASVGSAIAAQMGTMVVSEEIAALEIMSINPIRLLVMPRLLAMMIMTPLLAFYSCIMGVIGGGIVGKTQLDVAWAAYLRHGMDFGDAMDMYVGMLKAVVFGILITIIACHEGFSTTNGAVGVGNATRRTVIMAFLAILISGYMITRMFYV